MSLLFVSEVVATTLANDRICVQVLVKDLVVQSNVLIMNVVDALVLCLPLPPLRPNLQSLIVSDM